MLFLDYSGMTDKVRFANSAALYNLLIENPFALISTG